MGNVLTVKALYVSMPVTETVDVPMIPCGTPVEENVMEQLLLRHTLDVVTICCDEIVVATLLAVNESPQLRSHTVALVEKGFVHLTFNTEGTDTAGASLMVTVRVH